MKPETKRWLGLGLIIGPLPLLMLVLSAYAITNFTMSAMLAPTVSSQVESEGELALLIGNIVNVFLGFLGVLCLIGIIVGIPVGIVLLTLSESDADVKKQRAKELKSNPRYKNSL